MMIMAQPTLSLSMKRSCENSSRNKIRLDNTCETPAETLAGQPPTLKLLAWSAMCWTTGWIKRQNHACTDQFFSARVNCLQSIFEPRRALHHKKASDGAGGGNRTRSSGPTRNQQGIVGLQFHCLTAN